MIQAHFLPIFGAQKYVAYSATDIEQAMALTPLVQMMNNIDAIALIASGRDVEFSIPIEKIQKIAEPGVP